MLKLRLRDDRERRSDRFSFLRVLQLFAAVLLCTVLGMSQANAQTAVVTAGSPNTSAGSGTVTYSASVAITGPALNSEQQISNVTYAWGSSDTCNPTSSSSTTVTAQRSNPGASSSSVGCTVTWYIYNTHTQQTTTATASGGATVNFTLGVLWSPGTITGGILTSPQNQTSSPYSPLTVLASPGGGLTCTVGSTTATDTSKFNGSPSTTGNDTATYAWTASSGTFTSPSSASTTWTAPSVANIGSNPITLTLTISATAPAVTSPDGGTRGPSSISRTVQVYIPEVQLTINQQQVENGKSIQGTLSLKEPSSLPAGISVTLTSSGSGGAVSFSPASITVPGDGSSANVTITGTTTSTSLNDVSITASGGAYSTPQQITVYAITGGTFTVTPIPLGVKYQDTGGMAKLGALGGSSVSLEATATITPSGVSAVGLSLGAIQNATERTDVATYDGAVQDIIFIPGVGSNIPAYYAPEVKYIYSVAPCIDCAVAAPWYDGDTGFSGGTGDWQGTDDPHTSFPDSISENVYDGPDLTTAHVIGNLILNISNVDIVASYNDWCAVQDSSDNSLQYPSNASGSFICDVSAGAAPTQLTTGSAPGGSPAFTSTPPLPQNTQLIDEQGAPDINIEGIDETTTP